MPAARSIHVRGCGSTSGARARWLAATTAAAAICGSATARADDGLYGRFDGDLELRGAAGTSLAAGGPSFAIEAAALYLATAGVYAHYAAAFGPGGPRTARSVAAGVHVAPLFLARYALNREQGPAQLDLLIDSLGFEIGAFWAQPRGASMPATPGLELGLSLALPILPRVNGPFIGLRAALRYAGDDLCCSTTTAGPGPGNVVDRGAFLSLTFGWRQVVVTHAVDVGDRPDR